MIGPAQNMYLREATNSGRLPNLLDRFQKLQEVGVDLIRMRGGFQVLMEVRLGKCLDAVVDILEAALHAP